MPNGQGNLFQGYGDAPYSIKELGGTYLTKLAQEIQQLGADPLGQFLPTVQIPEEQVRVEWIVDSLRLTGVVRPGMPNGLNRMDKAQSFTVEPAYFRRGDFIDMKTINYLRQAGTVNKQWGMSLVERQLRILVDQANMMMSVLRAQLFTGAVAYTDPETGVSITSPSGIPVNNYYTIGAAGGGPLNTDFNAEVQWADLANAKIIDNVIKLKNRMWRRNRAMPTHMIMNGSLVETLTRNAQIRDMSRYDSQLASNFGYLGMANGEVDTICGVKIVKVNTIADFDQADGSTLRRYIIPVNKVIMLTANNPMLPSEPLGYTYLTKGEHPYGGMGMWVETMDAKYRGPQASPGVAMQVGMAGLPFFQHPNWVNVITVATEAQVTAISGTDYVS